MRAIFRPRRRLAGRSDRKHRAAHGFRSWRKHGPGSPRPVHLFREMPKTTDDTLSDTLRPLRIGDAARALQLCKAAGATYVDEAGLLAELRAVLTRTPQALADCPADVLKPMRIAAALSLLSGGRPVRSFIQIVGDYGYRHDAETVAHLLLLHAAYLRQRAHLARIGVKKLRLLANGIHSVCDTCRAHSRRRYTFEGVPELPLADCTCPAGCRSTLVAAL